MNKIIILDNSVQLYGEWLESENDYNVIKSFPKGELTYKICHNTIKFYATHDYFYRNSVFSMELPINIDDTEYDDISALTEELDSIFCNENYVDPSGHTIDLSDYYRKNQVDALLEEKQDVGDYLTDDSLKTINGISLIGEGDIEIGSGGTVDLSDYYRKEEVDALLEDKLDEDTADDLYQPIGDYITQIKTINGNSLIGEGNIEIGSGGIISIDNELSSTSENPVQNKIITAALNEKQSILSAGTMIDISNNTVSVKVWNGTLAEYNAIAVKDNSTLYLINEEE